MLKSEYQKKIKKEEKKKSEKKTLLTKLPTRYVVCLQSRHGGERGSVPSIYSGTPGWSTINQSINPPTDQPTENGMRTIPTHICEARTLANPRLIKHQTYILTRVSSSISLRICSVVITSVSASE